MKTLLLLRHAKSRWNDGEADHDRSLSGRGKKAAVEMGDLLRARGLVPDAIVTSTAKRARKTARRVAAQSGYRGEVRLEPALYLAAPEAYVRTSSRMDGAIERLMLIGHNPGIEMCVNLLCGSDESMPTAGLAVISVPIDVWSEMSLRVACELKAFWRPKELL